MTWYMKGQSDYESANFHMGLFFDMNGFASGDYATLVMPDDVLAGDPFLTIAAETQSWTPGSQVVELGLWDDYRIKIDSAGIWGWHEGSGDWFSLFGGGGDGEPTPDHNLLNGLNDGDDYEHITQAQKDLLHTIYSLEEHDNTKHNPDYLANISDDSSPQLGGDLDLNDKAITHELIAAVSLVAGDLCYMNGDGKMDKADASAEATCKKLLAMCLDTISADATGTFLIFGKWTTTGLTAGTEYWVSETAGAITITKPTTTGTITRHVGTSLSTTVLFFNPSHTYVEYVV